MSRVGVGRAISGVGDFLWQVALQILPFPPYGTADAFAEREANGAQAQAIVADSEAAILQANGDVAPEILNHARRMSDGEDQRQASVVGRAQGLFFAVALLSFFMTYSSTLVATASGLPPQRLEVFGIISAIILIQIVLLVFNVVKAIQGFNYLRAGSSDVARWSRFSTLLEVQRDQAISTLRWYRDSSRKNTWRFRCLERAIHALRNIVFFVCVLIGIFFLFALTPTAPPCSNSVEIKLHGKPMYTVQTACR